MSGEEIGLDFDIGISGGNTEPDVWQSDNESVTSRPSSEKKPDEPIELEEQVRRDTKLQLQRLLNITDMPNETENSDERD